MKIEQFCFLRHAGSWDAYLYNTLILDILEKHYKSAARLREKTSVQWRVIVKELTLINMAVAICGSHFIHIFVP